MRKLIFVLFSTIALALAGCSGSDNTLYGDVDGPGGTADVATLTLLTSSPQMPSDGTADATITALVRDENNNVLPDVSVIFTASSGSLTAPVNAITNESGIVTAVLSTAGDPTNRAITVTAEAGDAGATVIVNVIGTALLINGPSSLPLGQTGSYNVVLTDAGGTGIAGSTVTLSSSAGNGLSATEVATDAAGQADFTITANAGGSDTLTASALGLQSTLTVSVSDDTFRFTAPATNTEIPLNTNQSVTVEWQVGGADVPDGSQVSFSTTRGVLTPADGEVTTTGGNATIQVQAANAGPAVITATNAAGTSTQLAVEFVATEPETLELQADPFTLATNEQSAITAIVRDASGNLVKNQTIVFSLDDVTGGSLTVAQAQTNSLGRAQTFYNSSSTTSASNGVIVTATVQGTAVSDTVNLTVAQREVFISVGTGNEIFEENSAQYRKEWVVQVTDAQGNGVGDVDVSLSVLSARYWEGTRVWNGVIWDTPHVPPEGCQDEDALTGDPNYDRNGILDPGEDFNQSGNIEAGNRALVAAQGGGNTVTTDGNGFALVNVFWPQDHAYWLEVRLEASAAVQGTEFAKSATFLLEGAAEDFSDEGTAPPGFVSPFGIDQNCATWDF
jgi:hypothetical protein